MGMYTPALLPVLSGSRARFCGVRSVVRIGPDGDLAQPRICSGCDFAGPHGRQDHIVHGADYLRAAHSATRSRGGFMAMTSSPLTRLTFTDTANAPAANFGVFADFRTAAAAGNVAGLHLPRAGFLCERQQSAPELRRRRGRAIDPRCLLRAACRPRMEPNAAHRHLRRAWRMLRPRAAAGDRRCPDASVGEFGFDFKRFGLRVPTVLISPLIAPGSVFRVAGGRRSVRSHVDPAHHRETLELARVDGAGCGGTRCGGRTDPGIRANR